MKMLAMILLCSAAVCAEEPNTAQQVAAKQPGDVLLIPPQARADDWVQAYHFLQKQQASSNVIFKLRDGQLLKNILSIKVMPSGTVMAFELNTTAGIRYEIVKVEDIDEISQE